MGRKLEEAIIIISDLADLDIDTCGENGNYHPLVIDYLLFLSCVVFKVFHTRINKSVRYLYIMVFC